MVKKSCLIVMSLFLLSLLVSSTAGVSEVASRQQIKRQPGIPLALPDMVLEKIELESKPAGTLKRQVTISYWVYNDSSQSSICCPTEAGKKAWKDNPVDNTLYHIRVEGRTLPSGTFSQLSNGGNVGTMTNAHERQKYTATDLHSVRARREYRVIVDYGNWIHEKNENNNVLTKK